MRICASIAPMAPAPPWHPPDPPITPYAPPATTTVVLLAVKLVGAAVGTLVGAAVGAGVGQLSQAAGHASIASTPAVDASLLQKTWLMEAPSTYDAQPLRSGSEDGPTHVAESTQGGALVVLGTAVATTTASAIGQVGQVALG
jgi:hypothetical protein